jgi:plastocyanin
VQVGEESRNQAIQGMAYLPKNIWIDARDTIRFEANSAEIHTVTFLADQSSKATPPPFNPGDPKQILPVGGHVYHPGNYYNSGLLSTMDAFFLPITDDYTLQFPKTGTFTYWCLVHGKVMKGTVHVRPAGTHYPFTQRQYDRHGAKLTRAIVKHGYHLWHETAEDATNHRVFTGNDDDIAMVMRFIRHTVHVHVGETVRFKNIGMDAPHTVTFGGERPSTPGQPPSFFAPYGDPKHFGGGQLNSGILEPGSTFAVTFTKAGTYKYICALHDDMGMVGKVVVTS